MNLKVKKVSEGTKHYLEVAGELDAYTAPELRQKLIPLVEQKGHTLIVDLSDVTYMDSTGLGVFVGAIKAEKRHQSEVILKNMTERVRRLFDITGLDEIMTIQHDDAKGGAR